MPLVEADWQLFYGGIQIGANTDYAIVPPIEGLQAYPDTRSTDQQRLRRHGMLPGDDFLAGRSTTWQFRVTNSDPVAFADAWTVLSKALRPGRDEQELIFQIPGVAGGGVRRLIGRPRRLDVPVDVNHALGVATALVQFDSSDPRIYDDTEQSITTDLAASVAGLTWNLSWNLNWGGASTSGVVSLVNAGAFGTPWVATITGPVTNPSIENVDTGQILSFTAEGGLVLDTGDTLVVDSDGPSVLLNGTASRYNTLAGPVSWWDLEPGTTMMRFGGTTTGTPTMTVAFRSAWMI